MPLTLILEPGRVIVGNSGIFVTKVLYVKETSGKTFYVVDGAMNDLVRPAFYGAYHEIVPVHGRRRKRSRSMWWVLYVSRATFWPRIGRLPAPRTGSAGCRHGGRGVRFFHVLQLQFPPEGARGAREGGRVLCRSDEGRPTVDLFRGESISRISRGVAMDYLQFFKMSASGNDFIVIDNRDGCCGASFPDTQAFVEKVCRRRHSVGADG